MLLEPLLGLQREVISQALKVDAVFVLFARRDGIVVVLGIARRVHT